MIREFVQNGVSVKLDLSEQILDLDAPEDLRYEEPELSPVPSSPPYSRSQPFVSASVLSQKAKQFDDALYAAVEVAVQRGHGSVGSKLAFFRAWAEAAIQAHEHGEAACLLFAACDLGGAPLTLRPDMSARVEDAKKRFLADEGRSAPLGFYTQTEGLAALFRQDRLLMSEIVDPASAAGVAKLLASDADLLRSYRTILRIASKMTNPAPADVLDLLRAGEKDRARILVPSRSHEADLVHRLYGDRAIPDGFDLADELADRVEAGSLSLAPREDSGWYDHQTWALEPLVAPDRIREAERLRYSLDYRRHLRELFKGILALTRETHVKQLEPRFDGSARPPRPPVRIFISPELTAEPLATYYARRARSYRFVRAVLEETFGWCWRDLAFTKVEAAWPRVDEGLEGMEALFHGAEVRVCRELGLEADPTSMPGRDPDADDASFRAWVAGMERDPDLSRDTRMMVPVFYDVGRRRMKVWALLGWSHRPLVVGFHRPPRVLEAGGREPAGRLENLRRRIWREQGDAAAPQIEFSSAYPRVAFPVTAEIYVDRLLDRDAFRRLCDRLKTPSAILRALTAAA